VLRRSASLFFIALGLVACGQGSAPPISEDGESSANFEVDQPPPTDVSTSPAIDAEATPGGQDADAEPALNDTMDGETPTDAVSAPDVGDAPDADAVPGADVQDSVAAEVVEDALISPDVDATTTSPDSEDSGPEGVEATSCDGLDNGAACEDGSLCTLGDTCVIGVCQSGEPIPCNGQGLCRLGTCDPHAWTRALPARCPAMTRPTVRRGSAWATPAPSRPVRPHKRRASTRGSVIQRQADAP
jgi:hypothetical protein